MGPNVGASVEVGGAVTEAVGDPEAGAVVGGAEGAVDGAAVGSGDGAAVGLLDGAAEGPPLGSAEGPRLGRRVGVAVGCGETDDGLGENFRGGKLRSAVESGDCVGLLPVGDRLIGEGAAEAEGPAAAGEPPSGPSLTTAFLDKDDPSSFFRLLFRPTTTPVVTATITAAPAAIPDSTSLLRCIPSRQDRWIAQ